MTERGNDIVILARQHIFLVQAKLIGAPRNEGARERAISCHLACYDAFSDIQDQQPEQPHVLERMP